MLCVPVMTWKQGGQQQCALCGEGQRAGKS